MKKVDFIGKVFYNSSNCSNAVVVENVCGDIVTYCDIDTEEEEKHEMNKDVFLNKYIAKSPSHIITYYKGTSTRNIYGENEKLNNVLVVVNKYEVDDKAPRDVLVFDLLSFIQAYIINNRQVPISTYGYCYITKHEFFNNNVPCLINKDYTILDTVNCSSFCFNFTSSSCFNDNSAEDLVSSALITASRCLVTSSDLARTSSPNMVSKDFLISLSVAEANLKDSAEYSKLAVNVV